MDGKEAAVVTERPIEDRVAVQVGDDDNVDEDIRGGLVRNRQSVSIYFTRSYLTRLTQ